jgi:hypothetical protein
LIKKEKTMFFRLFAVAGFALAVATSAQALPLVPQHQPNNMITQAAFGCGPGRTLVNGVCVARSTIRRTRRQIRRENRRFRRCLRWYGGACIQWGWW